MDKKISTAIDTLQRMGIVTLEDVTAMNDAQKGVLACEYIQSSAAGAGVFRRLSNSGNATDIITRQQAQNAQSRNKTSKTMSSRTRLEIFKRVFYVVTEGLKESLE